MSLERAPHDLLQLLVEITVQNPDEVAGLRVSEFSKCHSIVLPEGERGFAINPDESPFQVEPIDLVGIADNVQLVERRGQIGMGVELRPKPRDFPKVALVIVTDIVLDRAPQPEPTASAGG